MLILNFDPFPIFETERLRFHSLSLEHAEKLYQLRGNELAMRYIGKPVLRSEAEAIELIEAYDRNLRDRIGITWGISFKDTPGLIGTIGYHKTDPLNYRAEIGYMIHPDHWFKGIMSEALKKVLDHGFNQIGFHSIEAKINPENEQSRSILLKHNFVKEAYFRESFFENGVFHDTEVYSLIANQAH
jgi:ribosomal-protein-alanine N-acetyltransferase